MATVGACAAFAAVCGSGIATAATMTTVALPEMKKYNYDSGLATGTLGAGGTIGILIPPSVIMVIYGMLSHQSTGTLFLAGFIPGIIQALMFKGYCRSCILYMDILEVALITAFPVVVLWLPQVLK